MEALIPWLLFAFLTDFWNPETPLFFSMLCLTLIFLRNMTRSPETTLTLLRSSCLFKMWKSTSEFKDLSKTSEKTSLSKPNSWEATTSSRVVKVGSLILDSHWTKTGLSGVERSVLGSVSDYITRHSELPVLVVRSETEKKEESTSTTYLVALDGSENSLQGLDLVASFFKESDKLCVAHITKYDFKDSDTQQKAVDKLKEEISKRVSLDLHLLFHLMHSQLPCMRL